MFRDQAANVFELKELTHLVGRIQKSFFEFRPELVCEPGFDRYLEATLWPIQKFFREETLSSFLEQVFANHWRATPVGRFTLLELQIRWDLCDCLEKHVIEQRHSYFQSVV